MTLALSPDEVAGVVDLFDAVTRAELDEALDELAYRRGEEPPAGAVEDALAAFALVAFEPADPVAGVDADVTVLAVGPTAFPELPEGAGDLPHIMALPPRSVDRAALATAVEERFRADVARAVSDDDDPEMRRLLDASYELEAWGPVELAELRARLDDALSD